MNNELRVLSPTGILGYGFPKKSFEKGMELEPDFIAVDAGSTDAGPYYLGEGISFTDKKAVKRDLTIILKAIDEKNIPFIIGSAGGAGAKPHVNWCEDIIREVAKENNLNFKMANIFADISKDWVEEKIDNDYIKPMTGAPPLSKEEVKNSNRIVAQMGTEPIENALDEADVILAGRANDPAVFAAMGIKNGFPKGLSIHLGKILECAAIAADPGSGKDCMFGILKNDCFEIKPTNPDRKCTTLSVAAEALYEKTNPLRLYEPGGEVNLEKCKYENIDERTVRVSGSKFEPKELYIKLEGAKKVGYRTISIAGIRDPIMINQIDDITEHIVSEIRDNFEDIPEESYKTKFRLYGKNGVMGELEPQSEITSHELGVIIEIVADTQKLANTICSFARSTMLHYGYPGRMATAGNLAFPYSPSDIKTGKVYEFSLYHLAKIEDPCKPFSIEVKSIGGGS
ncbi:acyclic terpene utilization AtuA family protein [Halarsenatibacter silvermanii]|uniref:Acyclic terpene utilisation N-terminal domain-containing protein n=1 Tax=Halarsenatibacter silvermanii TaxID=321763 RepID=A0A1G9TE75_9FIRM|nr:acyclic terpene utilization AtuA family protein [Halarsenatibacter silvermanii]SDM46059.1 Protein of unknown function [Halarsenatibacter silvermanii]